MARTSNLDKFKKVMFDDITDLTDFTSTEKSQLKRYRSAFTILLENPSTSDRKLVEYLITEFNISDTQAYRDVASIKVFLPSVRNAGKQWSRYLVEEELKQVITEAKELAKGDSNGDEEKDPLSIAQKGYLLEIRTKALDKLGKYTRLDKEDELGINWEDIVPIPIEPTNDVSVLKVKPLPNKEEAIKKLYDKYRSDIEIEDIDYEELKTND